MEETVYYKVSKPKKKRIYHNIYPRVRKSEKRHYFTLFMID